MSRVNVGLSVAVAAGLVLLTPLCAQPLSPADINDRDFRELTTLLPGQYNNQEQAYFQNEISQPEDQRRIHQNMTISALDDRIDGQKVFAANVREEADSGAVSHYAYVFSQTSDAGILQQLFAVSVAADNDTALNPADIRCQIQWRREGAQFSGRGNCPGQTHWILAPDTLWVGSPLPAEQNRAYVDYLRLDRASLFDCWAGVQRRDPEAGLYFKTGLTVHDQGGWIHLETDEQPPQKVSLKMRKVIWPYKTGRHSRVLYAHRENLDRAESYVWTGIESDRIAINLRWVQASCTQQESQP